ncbi:hypothetical protein PC116_g31628 [Phytophthora cactorum]|nr:hypothetical protein PC116_g31628 [Phytophthora cactorum]
MNGFEVVLTVAGNIDAPGGSCAVEESAECEEQP